MPKQSSFSKLRKEMVETKATEAPKTGRAGSQRKVCSTKKKLRNLNRIPWVRGQIRSCVCSGWDITRFRLRRNTKERTSTGKRIITGNWTNAGAHTGLGHSPVLINQTAESHDGTSALIRGGRHTMASPLSAMWGNSKQVAICRTERGPSPRTESAGTLIMDFPVSRC